MFAPTSHTAELSCQTDKHSHRHPQPAREIDKCKRALLLLLLAGCYMDASLPRPWTRQPGRRKGEESKNKAGTQSPAQARITAQRGASSSSRQRRSLSTALGALLNLRGTGTCSFLDNTVDGALLPVCSLSPCGCTSRAAHGQPHTTRTHTLQLQPGSGANPPP